MRLLDDSSQEGVNLLRSIADLFLPAVLFSKELRALPSIYPELRNYLDTKGCNLTQHSSRRIMMTLATNVYEEQEDKQAAVDIVQSIMAAGPRNRENVHHLRTPISVSPSATETSNSRGRSIEKVAHNVAMSLKEKDRKCSGAIGECWMEFVDEYKQITRDYGLSQTQKLQYMHTLQRQDAKRF